MNIHFPQSDLARAEAYTIAIGDEQYIVPTDGTPLRGLIQDHVVMGTLLTSKETMLTREEFQQLLYASLATLTPTRGSQHLRYQTPIITVPPCIVKPVPLWSGKQVVCTNSGKEAKLKQLEYLTVYLVTDKQSVDGVAEGLSTPKPRQQHEDSCCQLEGSQGRGNGGCARQ